VTDQVQFHWLTLIRLRSRSARLRSRARGYASAAALVSLASSSPAGDVLAQAPAPPVAVSLTQQPIWSIHPSTSVLQPGQTLRFSTGLAPEQSSAATWQASGGIITDDGVYTASPTPGQYQITATLGDGVLRSSASVTVEPPQGTTTAAADRLVDSVGVNIHLHYNGTLYREQFDLTRQRLLELGVRHYRDILVETAWQPYYDRHNALGAAGLRGLFVLQKPRMPAAVLQEFPLRVPASFDGYEAPNEHDAKGEADWAASLRDSVVQLQTLKRIPALARFSLYGPALAFTNRHAELGDVSAQFEYGNLHNYFAGRHPGTTGWGVTDRAYASYAWHLRYARQYFGGRPIVTTETGYFDDPGTTDSIPRDVAGKYMPRLLLEQFRNGITRTYIYELADESGRRSHGLVTADGSPKPAFRAVAHLLRLLSDPGPPHAVRPLSYTVSGVSADVRHLTFQKRDGRYYLAIWIERSAYDVAARRHSPVSPETASLVIDGGLRPVAIHRWQADGSMESTPVPAGGMRSLTVTDTLQVLELHP
jgi:hypothetical protein